MMVLMAAAPGLDKDLHTNGYEMETWITFNNHFDAGANVPFHVENHVILMNKYIWILNLNLV